MITETYIQLNSNITKLENSIPSYSQIKVVHIKGFGIEEF
jgi:hypothetical protein